MSQANSHTRQDNMYWVSVTESYQKKQKKKVYAACEQDRKARAIITRGVLAGVKSRAV